MTRFWVGMGDAMAAGSRNAEWQAQQASMDRQAARAADEALTAEIDRLKLVVEALWGLASEKLGITTEELAERVRAIDASDGVIDGRHTVRPRPCTSCDAMVPGGRSHCQFCGAAVPAGGGVGPATGAPPPPG